MVGEGEQLLQAVGQDSGYEQPGRGEGQSLLNSLDKRHREHIPVCRGKEEV